MDVKNDLANVAQREFTAQAKARRAAPEKGGAQKAEREHRPEVKISDAFAIEIQALRHSENEARHDLKQVEKLQRSFEKIEPLLLQMRTFALEVSLNSNDLSLDQRDDLQSAYAKLQNNVIRIAERIELPGTDILELGLVIPEPPGPGMSALPVPTLPSDPIPHLQEFGNNEIQTLDGSRLALVQTDSALSEVAMLQDLLGVVESRLEEKIQEIQVSVADELDGKREQIGTDEARRRADMTRDQMIQHARQARRAHANISVRTALDLLQDDS